MRARTQAELNDPARLERLQVNPYTAPRQLREGLRQLLAEIGTETVRDILVSEKTRTEDRLRALEIAYRYGIGTQTGLVDADNESLPGVIALPALDMERVQSDVAPLRLLPGGNDDDSGTETGPPAGDAAGNRTAPDAPG